MNDSRNGMRSRIRNNWMLAAAMAVGLGVCAISGAAKARAQQNPHSPSAAVDPLVGTWQGAIEISGAGFNYVLNYNSDGTAVEIDNFASGSYESPSIGAWKKTDASSYVYDLRQFAFNPDGSFAGTYRVRSLITLEANENAFTFTFHYVEVDATGNVITSGYGTGNGARLIVQ
jgi:hypothetical protein